MRLLALSTALPSVSTVQSVLIEQLLNSVIVAGIAGIAVWTGTTPDYLVITKAFILTFLIELRKYRGIPPSGAPGPQPQATTQ